jgi:hypothetical protein
VRSDLDKISRAAQWVIIFTQADELPWRWDGRRVATFKALSNVLARPSRARSIGAIIEMEVALLNHAAKRTLFGSLGSGQARDCSPFFCIR